jgi:hypothetical protein
LILSSAKSVRNRTFPPYCPKPAMPRFRINAEITLAPGRAPRPLPRTARNRRPGGSWLSRECRRVAFTNCVARQSQRARPRACRERRAVRLETAELHLSFRRHRQYLELAPLGLQLDGRIRLSVCHVGRKYYSHCGKFTEVESDARERPSPHESLARPVRGGPSKAACGYS